MEDKKIYLDKKGKEQYMQEFEDIKEKLKENSKSKSSAHTDAVGDGWHDNFAFEEAKRKENELIFEIEKKIQGIRNIVIVEKGSDATVVDIDDIVEIKVIYAEDDIEQGIYKLIGGTRPNTDAPIQELTINSPVGEGIYKKKAVCKTSCKINGREVPVEILGKIINPEIEPEQQKRR